MIVVVVMVEVVLVFGIVLYIWIGRSDAMIVVVVMMVVVLVLGIVLYI